MTSRPEQEIKTGLSNLVGGVRTVPIDCDQISDDIYKYVHAKVWGSDGLTRWSAKVRGEIEERLLVKANGM
jgi:hypothetical protein